VKPAKPPRASRRRQPVTRVPVTRRLLKAGLIFTTCALALNALIGARGLPAVLDARSDYRALAADLERIRHENARLRQEVSRLRDDPQTIEEIARRDLHFMRPGEKLFLLRTAEPPDARTPR
jgi:cell division protein FtsB